MSSTTTMPGAVRAVLPNSRRQHFQHGPIDLVIECFGESSDVRHAYDQAWDRFEGVLAELAGELSKLRTVISATSVFTGATARRMVAACRPHARQFITPMAAVAGAVADEILGALSAGRTLRRAYVNNGGDIAVHLAPGETFTTGLVILGETPAVAGTIRLRCDQGVRGIASSGWRGRSLSRGIADSVTVLASSAAVADAAATLIANDVYVETSTVRQVPAHSLDPDSDLGDRLVTVAVGDLTSAEISHALDAGSATAQAMLSAGLIQATYLALADKSRVVGATPSLIDLAGQRETA